MALPKLNDTPSYTVTVPSTGQQTTFRPFLVKEQKALICKQSMAASEKTL